MSVRNRLAVIAAGLLSGLVAGLGLTLIQLAMRRWWGISPPQEMIPDRFAPTLSVDRFIELVNEYGYNDLKRFGIQAGLTGLLVAATAIGVGYALISERRSARARGRQVVGTNPTGLAYVVIAFVVLYAASLAVLWPNLDTNTKGLPPSQARLVTAAGYFGAYLSYALLLIGTYWFMTRWIRQGQPGPAVSPLAGGETTLSPQSGSVAGEPGRFRQPVPRRAVVAALVGALFAWPSVRLLRRFEDRATFAYDGRRYSGPGIQAITPQDKFYTVTKNTVDPDVDRDVWRLEVNGHVERSHTYDFDELAAFQSTTQLTTLMCISNHVSAGLMSNAEWRGVPMADLLFAAGVKPGAVEVVLRGADGYTDTFAIDKALDPTTLVVYEINGEPLSRIHGFPVRIIVPGLFGEKNVKWVTGIEVVTSDVKGFYEQQGWGPNFEIPTRSDFFAPAMNSGNRSFREPFALNQPATLRGRAFGGARDISKVEISLDDGETWQEVTTFDYQGTNLTWKFWSYRWTPRQAGEFVLAVRAYDGTGALQPVEPLPSDPREGTTGMHRVRATVE